MESAIQNGIRVLGFSDHAPYVFEGEYYSSFRMKPDQLEEYVTALQALRREYQSDIEIHIGLEAEYYPRFFDAFLSLIAPYPIEYLLLGQHFLGDEMGREATIIPSGGEQKLKTYVSQTGEALKTGRFRCFAHPDILNFTGDALVYERETRTLCENAKKANVPLEINLLGVRTRRAYPRPAFWRIAGEVGCDVVCGSDAHAACDVCDAASWQTAMDMAKKYRLRLREARSILPTDAKGEK